jgi:thioredoxin 1
MSTALTVSFLVIALLIAYMVYSYRRIKNMPEVESHSSIKTLTDANFSAQVKNGLVLVDFWAAWCMPCRMMAPILNEMAEELGSDAHVAKIDIDANRASAAKYSVRSIPTLILFRNGKEINRFVGVKTKDFLVKEIRKNL